jgi:antitoxin (DNA-binding transcriptional repressor) of toxin-antitoxin stability system
MSHTLSIDEAAAKLDELVGSLNPGDEIVLTRDDRPVARILPSMRVTQRRAGNCKGMLLIHEDDERHLDDFREYMP